MNYPKSKIYHDGSHYIAIPRAEVKNKKRKSHVPNKTLNEKIETILDKNKNKTKQERIDIAIKTISDEIKNEKLATELVNKNIERIKRNVIERRKRLSRKAHIQQWNYFCTFTYDSTKLTADEFREKFSNCIKHLASRKKWKYIGVWEKSPEKQRLHFHGLFYIPQMVGELIETRDYSTTKHQMQITMQNTFFLERFGRNDFREIPPIKEILTQSINYLMKYIQKTGERIVYSKGVGTYFVSDILGSDVVCTIGQEDKKLLLFDDFMCFIDGELIGTVSDEVISRMPKEN